MKPEEPKSIGSILDQFLKLKEKALPYQSEGDISKTWGKVAGKYISDATDNAILRRGTLTLSFNKPTIKMEVMMNRKHYIREINSILGSDIIRDIRFL